MNSAGDRIAECSALDVIPDFVVDQPIRDHRDRDDLGMPVIPVLEVDGGRPAWRDGCAPISEGVIGEGLGFAATIRPGIEQPFRVVRPLLDQAERVFDPQYGALSLD